MLGRRLQWRPKFKFQRTGIEARYRFCSNRGRGDIIGSSRSSSIVGHFVSRLGDRSCGHPKRPDGSVGKPVVVGMYPRAR
jgi:hypothetical protein